MTTALPLTDRAAGDMPEQWRDAVQKRLAAGENVVTWITVDLDAQHHFSDGIVVLTESRVLARAPGENDWRDWAFQPGMTLEHHDHAGVGHLELMMPGGRLAAWHFTLGMNLLAMRVIDQFQSRLQSHVQGIPLQADDLTVCPSCKAPLEPDQDVCPVCTKVIHTPPSTWTLFRLWRFARPYRGQLLAGFLLTLLGTAASLVPPYLTMPLMDNVLIPYQNGQQIDTMLVGLYLSGLLGAALLAWGLTWAKTYILALVSERIGADLRTSTYEHLLRLSLEYFGGKRTGDLMARIGSESDRI